MLKFCSIKLDNDGIFKHFLANFIIYGSFEIYLTKNRFALISRFKQYFQFPISLLKVMISDFISFNKNKILLIISKTIKYLDSNIVYLHQCSKYICKVHL